MYKIERFIIIFVLVQNIANSNQHLSHETEPEHYSLAIAADFDAKNSLFFGEINILINVKTNTKYIILHSKELNISSRTIIDVFTQSEIPVKTHYLSETNEQYTIELKNALVPKRKYMVSLEFSGLLNNDMVGFYKSYNNQNSPDK